MSNLPGGTITFVFTDIEGSTRLLQDLGEKYLKVLEDHRRLLRSAFRSHGGREVDTQGDAFFYAFHRASDAVSAAIAAQRAITSHAWPDGILVRIRTGLHTGEALQTETGYAGMAVHRAARICAAAHGGQILVSQATRELVADAGPDGMNLLDLGEHRLKDLSRPQRLFQVVAPDLPDEFPSLRTLDSLPNNLPRQLTSFIGRDREITEIKELLERTMLLTLTGVGGSGKTRLALQVAADVVDHYPDGVWWVPLAPLSEPSLIPQAVASATGIREQRGRPLMDVLLGYLGPKTLLLALDNVEHMLAGAADFIDALLRRCSGVRILVTSREPLKTAGEHAYPVPPLPVPSPGIPLPITSLAQADVVRLFLDRATAARPSFALNAQNAAAVIQICRRVDGIPLAVELAAARVKVLSAQQIAARLDDQFRLLTSGSTTALPRHQTLLAAMDWSHDLLTEPERTLFRRLAVFAGSFSLEAAEIIPSGAGLENVTILDLLTRLVERSLVAAEEEGEETRFRLLEPVRQYALRKGLEAREDTDVRARHRDFFLALAERGHSGLAGPERLVWRDRIETDHDNIRAAIRWSIDIQDLEPAARLCASMARFWAARGFLNEGWTALQEVQQHETRVSPRTRGRLLTGIGLLAFEIGEHGQAEITEQALSLFRQLQDRPETEICARLLGMVELERGHYERAAPLLEEAATLAREREDPLAEAEALRQRGYLAAKQGDYALATQLLEKSLVAVRSAGLRRSIGFALGHLAQTYHYMGQTDRAVTMLKEALDHLQAVEHGTGIAYFLNLLGLALLQQGDHAGAAGAYRRSLTSSHETGYRWGIAQSLIGFGAMSAAKGDAQMAVRLLAAADALLTKIDYAIPAAEQAYFRHLVENLRRSMGENDFTRAWHEGGLATIEEAIESALMVWQDQGHAVGAAEPSAPMVGSHRAPRTIPTKKSLTALSKREREVVVLVTEGRTNREIAEILGIAEKTANAHIQNILNKLGFTSRAQIAAWASAHGLTSSEPK